MWLDCIQQLCIKTLNACIYLKKYENICEYCLDGEIQDANPF